MTKMISITRKEKISIVYTIEQSDVDGPENGQNIGLAPTRWYGGTYDLFVTIEGNINSTTGYLFDLKALKEIIRRNVLDQFNNTLLEKGASLELLVMELFFRIASVFSGTSIKLVAVRMSDRDSLEVRYTGG